MKRFDAGAMTVSAICGLGAAGLVVLAAALPATWLQWEGAAAQTQAQLMAGAASSRAQAGLGFLFTSFERATASLHPDQLTGDTVALTAKLLRIEPLVAPVSGVAVVNQGGLQVAASSVTIDTAPKPLWWTGAMPDLPKHDAGLLGCGGARPYVAGFVLARRIADDTGNAAGAVAGLLAAPDLLNLIQPESAGVAFNLRDARGCVLLHSNDARAPQATGEDGALIGFYRHLLPAGWGLPAATEVTASVGNLIWNGTISPRASLALRQAEIGRHGTIIEGFSGALAGLALLLATVPYILASSRRGRADVKEAARQDIPAPPTAPEPDPAPAAPTALVVGFTAAERQRVAARLERAGMEAETAEDSFLALSLPDSAAYMHGALDLMVLDGAHRSFPVQDLLTRLQARDDLDRLRIVLVANGCFAGAFGGPAQRAAGLDALVTEIFVNEIVTETREALLVGGE
jgi:hypothetical protein